MSEEHPNQPNPLEQALGGSVIGIQAVDDLEDPRLDPDPTEPVTLVVSLDSYYHLLENAEAAPVVVIQGRFEDCDAAVVEAFKEFVSVLQEEESVRSSLSFSTSEAYGRLVEANEDYRDDSE